MFVDGVAGGLGLLGGLVRGESGTSISSLNAIQSTIPPSTSQRFWISKKKMIRASSGLLAHTYKKTLPGPDRVL